MSEHTPHELHDEFPHDIELLHRLKVDNAHYGKLVERYHELNRTIHRIEAEIEPASDAHAEDLKKQRLALLDEVAKMIEQARAEPG